MSNRLLWPEVQLGDMLTIQHGWPFKSDLFSEELTGNPIIVSIGNFEYTGGFRFNSTKTKEYRGEYPPEYRLSPGDILLIMTCQTPGGEILGIPAYVPNDGRVYLHNQRVGKVIINRPDLIDANFSYWVFLWSQFNQHLYLSATGTKILHTSPSRIESFRLCLPPLRIQRRIADILGTLDDKIDVNRRINATLEAMAQALFTHWFVDFAPFRDGPFVETALGPVPQGWRIGSLGDIAENERIGIEADKINPDTPYIGLADMPQGSIALDTWGLAEDITSIKSVIKKGQLLFGKLRPYFKKVGISPIDGVCSTDILVVEPKHHDYYGFIISLISSDDFINYTTAVSDGTRMPRVTWQMMAKYPVVLPTSPITRRFNHLVEPWIQIIVSKIFENRALAATRDYLLPRLLSGAISLEAAEEIVEAEGHSA